MDGRIKLTTKQFLLYLVDGFISISEPFDRHGMYRKSIDDYYSWREIDKKRFRDNLNRLKKEGFIKIYLKGKQGQIELTDKGKDRVRLFLVKDFEFVYPAKWDGKWRLIIFDVPNKRRGARDILRFRLKSMGCFQLQESVFVFPFDCKGVIDYIKDLYEIKPYVQYIIAETIETEIDLIKKFLDKGILRRGMIEGRK